MFDAVLMRKQVQNPGLFLMPTLEEFRQRSKEPEKYCIFIDKFVRAVVGAAKFGGKADKELLSRWCKVGDEALALLLIENQEERWKFSFAHPHERKCPLPGKFTDGGKPAKEGGKNRANQGWSKAGLLRFNELFEMVENDRNTDAGMRLEIAYLQHRKRMIEESKKRSGKDKKTYLADGEAPVVARNEMTSLVFGGARTLPFAVAQPPQNEGNAGNENDRLVDLNITQVGQI